MIQRVGAAVAMAVTFTLTTACADGGAATGANLAALRREARLAPCPSAPSTAATTASSHLPDVTLACIGGGPEVNLSALRGPIVVNIYGTWCKPCGQEAGYLSQVARQAGARVRFLGVDTSDNDIDALTYAHATRPPAHYPLVADPAARVVPRYAPGPPVTVFVDRSGVVVGVHRGPYGSAAQLRADIRRYLGVTL